MSIFTDWPPQTTLPPSGAAGGDLSGTYPNPSVVALHSGATQLTVGAFVDGEFVKRVGGTLVTAAVTPAIVAPTNFTWAANAASIDVSAARDFRATNALAGNSTLTLTNGTDGCYGQIFVAQDATGNRTMTFSIAGRTIVRDLNVADDNPLGVASSQTIYQYYFYTSPAGTASVNITKLFTQ